MAVEIVVSSEMSRDMDPETAVFTSYLTRGFSPRLQTDVIGARTPFQEFFVCLFLIKDYDGRQFFLIVHHQTSNVH